VALRFVLSLLFYVCVLRRGGAVGLKTQIRQVQFLIQLISLELLLIMARKRRVGKRTLLWLWRQAATRSRALLLIITWSLVAGLVGSFLYASYS